ncbi:hypothetical protein BE18_44520 [Sorangium cellulosum]|uniref:Uncharacterized protein n=1 Tax=Sorangium cellulosum TaxID=56 RepID=A0A150RFE3_SORCE|nr:hypothetical protein BE18_44520 [Sorangium cellulosum]
MMASRRVLMSVESGVVMIGSFAAPAPSRQPSPSGARAASGERPWTTWAAGGVEHDIFGELAERHKAPRQRSPRGAG